MTDTLYPFGYGTTTLTFDQLMTRITVNRLHPEFRRRVFAMMEAAAEAGVPLGIGTGWRVQPDPPPPGFAKPGNSNHESFPAGSGAANAVAADMVPTASFPWMAANCGRYGLRDFAQVNGEPWHVQPSEIPAGRNWRKEPWDLAEYPLPVKQKPPTGAFVAAFNMPAELVPQNPPQTGRHVVTIQSLLKGLVKPDLKVDGVYGIVTIGALQDFQASVGLTVDGKCGPKTTDRLLNG